MFGASLVALRKKDGGLRPIAIGLLLRRVLSRVCCITLRERTTTLLKPFQLGLGTPGGAEAAVHATRRFIASCTGPTGIAKLDFVNAFNCIQREHVVNCVSATIPELLNVVIAAYGSESDLFFGTHKIKSASGVQQGDPLGPLLFALGVRHLSHGATCPFVVWYLDDATLGGSIEEVSGEIERIRKEASAIGLELNPVKCEVVSDSQEFSAALTALLPGCKLVSKSDCTLLGAPIGLSAAVSCIDRRAATLKSITPRLAAIDRHDAFTLLRVSLGHPRMGYDIRAGSSYAAEPSLGAYDKTLREAFEVAACVSVDDRVWEQATLPPLLGGIGLRSVTDHALPSFLASCSSTEKLPSLLCKDLPDATRDSAIDQWKVKSDARGDHALSCNRGAGRGARHKEVNERIRAGLATAGCVTVLEPTGLMRSDGKRPDGVTVLPYERGLPLAWDATITHTCAQSYLQSTAINAGAAAATAEARKESKYARLEGKVMFSAVAFETLGPVGPSAARFLDGIADRILQRTGDTQARERFYRRLAAAVQLGNAACIIEAHSRQTPGREERGSPHTSVRRLGPIERPLLKGSAATGPPNPN